MEHMSNIFSTSFGINFAKLTHVWLALISLTAKINSLLFLSHLYIYIKMLKLKNITCIVPQAEKVSLQGTQIRITQCLTQCDITTAETIDS